MIGDQPEINNNFPTGNLDDFLNEFSQPKKDMNIDELAGLKDLQKEEPEPESELTAELQDLQMKANVAKSSGKLIAIVIDTTFPAALGFIAKENATEYKADEEDRDELEKALTEYMRLKGGDIPPGMMVFILILSIYGAKIPIAVQHRKLHEKEQYFAEKERKLEEREKILQQKETEK